MTLNDFRPDYLAIELQDDVAVVRFIVPRLTEEVNLEQVGHELFALKDQFGCRRVVVSLKGIEYMTSSGVGKLIALHRKMHREKGHVVLCEIEPAVNDILKTSRLDSYFVIRPALAEAVEAARTA